MCVCVCVCVCVRACVRVRMCVCVCDRTQISVAHNKRKVGMKGFNIKLFLYFELLLLIIRVKRV